MKILSITQLPLHWSSSEATLWLSNLSRVLHNLACAEKRIPILCNWTCILVSQVIHTPFAISCHLFIDIYLSVCLAFVGTLPKRKLRSAPISKTHSFRHQISSKLIKDLVGNPRKDWDRHDRQLCIQRFSCRRNHIEFIIIQSLTKSLASICHCSLTLQRSQNTGSGCIAWPWIPTVPLLLKKSKQSLLIFICPSRLGHGYKPNRVR